MSDFLKIDISEEIIRCQSLIKKGERVLLVEGKTDARTFSILENIGSKIHIFDCDGKENVIGIISDSDLSNNEKIYAFIDKDFDDVLPLSFPVDIDMNNLIKSEYSSLEYYLMKSDGFTKLLKDIIKPNTTLISGLTTREFICHACNLVRYISIIRLYNFIEFGDIKFDDLLGLKIKKRTNTGKNLYDLENRYKSFSKFIEESKTDLKGSKEKTLSIINSKLHNCSSKVSKKMLSDFIIDIDNRSISVPAQGHDLVSSAVILIKKYCKDYFILNDLMLESILISHFTVSEMTKYNSTNLLLKWAKNEI